MTKPTVKIVNAETGEEIEREMNAAEFAQYEEDQAQAAAQAVAQHEAAATRQAILDRLGLTKEEATLLLGANQ